MKLYLVVDEKILETENYLGCLAITNARDIDPNKISGNVFRDSEEDGNIFFSCYIAELSINKLIEYDLHFSNLYNNASNKELKDILLNSVLQLISDKPEHIILKFSANLKQCAFDMLAEKYGKIEFLKQAATGKYKYNQSDIVLESHGLCLWTLANRFGITNDPKNFWNWFKNI